ncbi:hypothetical protein A9W99_11220 [Mycobacterium sp. 1164966.3]|uniref:hypothetical protein n=1 Tax=Mycobacterium sp. 1164966.3 TaxID=1856861 RepID=UPI0007FCB9EC|nr:hypothetical protein [Mycobacterium sp. 1164966.3]OBA82674.1 hypothetical protein A9W99_11220 [Mycobacterium sp. 1164966.3]
MKIDKGRGIATYAALRRDNGVTIHQGASRIMLAPDELAELLDAIQAITGQCSRKAEKAIAIDEQR